MMHQTCPNVTHRTELWLANDETSYIICDRIVTEYVEECGNLSDPDLNDLANIMLTAMKNHWGERTPDDDDILEADWFEIAEGWFNDIKRLVQETNMLVQRHHGRKGMKD